MITSQNDATLTRYDDGAESQADFSTKPPAGLDLGSTHVRGMIQNVGRKFLPHLKPGVATNLDTPHET
ncbi:MAG: hypothetical protein WBG17_00505 [Burkholderiaceae bacterium]